MAKKQPVAPRTLRDDFAIAALTGYSANLTIMQKAIDDWQENGGPRPC